MRKTRKMSLGIKSVIIICSMVAILGAVLGTITAIVFDRTIDTEFESKVTDLAHTTAVSLNGDNVKLLRDEIVEIYEAQEEKVGSDGMGTPAHEKYIANFMPLKETAEYKEEVAKLQKLAGANEVESVYILYAYPKDKITLYVADGSEVANDPGDFDPLYEVNYGVLEDPTIGFPAYITNTPEYGWLVSAAYPIYTSDGEVAAFGCVDISMNAIKAESRAFSIMLFIITIAIGLILTVIYILAIQKAVVSPINKLADAATSYVKNDNEAGFKDIEITTGDEIESLSDAMKKMEQDIKDYIANLTAVTAEKERIGAELNVATQIQADMLPRIFPTFTDKKEYELFASMDPAKEVGGDFYDFFIIDDTHLGLVVADVSGKGVPAALFMVIAKTLIKNRAMMGGTPGEVLAYANDQLCEGNDAELFVTVWFAIIDVTTGKGIAVNAGHEHPAIRRAGGQFELSIYKHSVAVATMEGIKFREHEFELGHGDTLFCYTDGVTEATDAHNVLFGNDRLLAALNKDPDANAEQICKNVKESINEFVGEAPQFDDITM
ncbi:MAG: SpoIIE family protein phosphatase, partial [Butyrivibrio sp.]|nr:SpoIIE family protein phosphatase [Butyrivibrio sp.]